MVINVKPCKTITFALKDREYRCTFNMLAMAYMQEELSKIDKPLTEVSPARMASIILYSGIKANHEDFTMDEAVALAMNLGPAVYGDMIAEYNDAMIKSMDKEKAKLAKKLTAQYLSNVMK